MPTDFDFEEGDTVQVTVRENGDSGTKQAEFTAECDTIRENPAGSPVARFPLSFGTLNALTIRPYEAEFEVIEDGE